MTELLLVLKATAILALGLTTVSLLRRAAAAARALVVACTFGALLVLPLAAALLPPVALTMPALPMPIAIATTHPAAPPAAAAARTIANRTASPAPAVVAQPSLSWRAVAWSIWAIVALFVVMPVVFAIGGAMRLRRTGTRWTPIDVPAHIDVRLHEAVATPGTFGVIRPTILFPAEAATWHEREIRQALVHELEHVRRGDWVIHLLARIVCGLYWFHPLVWVAWRRLRIDSEHASDDAVVRECDQVSYAQQLVTLAQRLSTTGHAPLLSMGGTSELSARVTAVLDGTIRRGRTGRPAAIVVTAAALFLVAILSPLRAIARPGLQAAGGGAAGPHRGDLGADVKDGGATISGSLYDPFGDPVEGIYVDVEGLQFGTWKRGADGPFFRGAITDSAGHFEFRYLRPGLYGLTAPVANGIVPVQVTVQPGEHVERDLHLRLEPMTGAFTVCRDCEVRSDNYQLPDSIAEEFARDEQDAVKQPVILPEPIDGYDAPRPIPEYPPSLKRTDLQGTVIVEGTIGVDGHRTGMRVVSSPHHELAEAALAMLAAEQWKPAYVRGTAVEVPFRVTIDFVLHDRGGAQ